MIATMLGGCLVLRPSALGDDAVSVVGTSSGWLHRGARLPDRGPAFERARPGEATHSGVPRLVTALEHAAAVLQAQRDLNGYCWRAGFAEWVPIAHVAELKQAESRS
ncbi:MAG: hypothetical protein J0L92_23950, partial [Deltaproteobacteria bacterium]|nr:hypothetical protein [Deltaproteobacteria bacterium]